MAEQGQFRRVITNLTHGGHAILDSADEAEKTAQTQESLSTRSTVVQESTDDAAHVGTTSFDYLFPDLAKKFPDSHLPTDDVPKVVQALLALGSAIVETPEEVRDPELNSPIPPVYTYWGQFVDHDLTAATDRDLVINITDENLPPVPPDDVVEKLQNLRIPTLNLDSVYGDGPFAPPVAGTDAVPYDGIKLRLGLLSPVPAAVGALIPPVDDTQRDLPRKADRTPLVGDTRNDENLVVAQLHVAFLRFHNAAVDWVRANEPEFESDAEVFRRARDLTRWTYQWLSVHDYLRTVARPDVVDLVDTAEGNLLELDRRGTYMPIEFSVAAFRFGHSMVRGAYDWNRNFGRPGDRAPVSTLDQLFQFTGRGGFVGPLTTLPSNWPAEWDRMVDKNSQFGNRFTRLIDTRLAPPLAELRNEGNDPSLPERIKELLKHLAQRNLLRGYRLAAPTGQAVAGALGVAPLTRAELEQDSSGPVKDALEAGGLFDRTPLWFYILKEAEVRELGRRLGEVGSRIVAETLIGQLRKDPGSYVNRTSWSPAQGVLLPNGRPVRTIADFLRFARVL
ncbi:Animal haem peroxidase [Streptomyces sp. 3213]|uniref:peroxidase family protein n=1 Tax=Streptomyces sp. 3213.3 TaxID=1855348 RepID=UPI00089D9747|nr:heme peroxidase family protein [Streptomyces sp. 3213.3]SEE85207.1 Animal haem peroxidase [Streptomyces sp. 3213] [Streptomyces sp. 3213.3]